VVWAVNGNTRGKFCNPVILKSRHTRECALHVGSEMYVRCTLLLVIIIIIHDEPSVGRTTAARGVLDLTSTLGWRTAPDVSLIHPFRLSAYFSTHSAHEAANPQHFSRRWPCSKGPPFRTVPTLTSSHIIWHYSPNVLLFGHWYTGAALHCGHNSTLE